MTNGRFGPVFAWTVGLAYWLALLGTTVLIQTRDVVVGLQVTGLAIALLLVRMARREAMEYAESLAYRDPLTGLPNRTYFTEALESALARAKRNGKAAGVLFIDLDHFKLVNDTLGHSAGDRLLVELSRRLKKQVRSGEMLARLGGDEFAILLEGLKEDKSAEIAAKRVLTSLQAPFMIGGHEVVAASSVGLAVSGVPPCSADELVRRADVALYDAKAAGRGCWKAFEPDKGNASVERLEMNSELRNAIQRNELCLYFQPEVNLTNGEIEGFEALVRWRHPNRGLLLPGSFIGPAEEAGFISAIGRWVLREACTEAVGWDTRFPQLPQMTVNVNLSPLEFHQRELVSEVAEILRETGLAPQRLTLEIVETALMSDIDATLATLHGLRQLGVKLAIDDFGTGYSSLAYLRRFPVDVLKIDQSFVREASEAKDVAAIVDSVVSMAHALGLHVTAEGVETREQLAFLIKSKCDSAQGYLFARPLPQAAIANFLASGSAVEAA